MSIDFLPTIPEGVSDKEKIKLLYKYIEQLWQKQIQDRANIEKVLSLVDANISTKRITELIGDINGHTGVMPDRKGDNQDHDMRYITRREHQLTIGAVTSSGLKYGATQVGAGAAAGEPWYTESHASLPDGVLMWGI
jgi:hypothetical protein